MYLTHPHWSYELMSQMTPCVKILCSYMAMSSPRVNGVNFSIMIELVGCGQVVVHGKFAMFSSMQL